MNQQITSQQYQQILKYMQTTRQQDFNIATEMLKAHNFNLENAIRTKLGTSEQESNRGYGYQQQYGNMNDTQENIRAIRNTRNQQDIRRYLQFLKQKQNKSVLIGLLNYAKDMVVGLVTGITQLIMPQFILRKILRSKFSNMYKQKILPEIKDQKLSKILKNSYISRKPIMFIISDSQTIHDCIINLLNRPAIAKKINQSFILSGAIQTDKQCDKIQGQKQPPTIVICRYSVFEKLEITKKYIGERMILEIDVDKLNYVLRDHQRAARKDRNLLVKYRNYIRRNYYGNRPGYYQQQQEEEELYHYQKPTVISDMIKQQNQDYKKVEQQTRRKQSLQLLQKQKKLQQQQKHKQIQQQRKIRKMSIPDQPIDSQIQIIKFSFRCPNGNIIIRKFGNQEKLDLIYHWVQTNQEIQFQDNKKRQFQLLHGFPPSTLSGRKQEKLKEVFESDQEKIIIREL